MNYNKYEYMIFPIHTLSRIGSVTILVLLDLLEFCFKLHIELFFLLRFRNVCECAFNGMERVGVCGVIVLWWLIGNLRDPLINKKLT